MTHDEYIAWIRNLPDLSVRIAHDRAYGAAFYKGQAQQACRLAGVAEAAKAIDEMLARWAAGRSVPLGEQALTDAAEAAARLLGSRDVIPDDPAGRVDPACGRTVQPDQMVDRRALGPDSNRGRGGRKPAVADGDKRQVTSDGQDGRQDRPPPRGRSFAKAFFGQDVPA